MHYLSILRREVGLFSALSVPRRLASHIHAARQNEADDLHRFIPNQAY